MLMNERRGEDTKLALVLESPRTYQAYSNMAWTMTTSGTNHLIGHSFSTNGIYNSIIIWSNAY
jgi:hypothetical protein